MERAESCRGLISGHPNTASRMGKQRLKAGKGSDFRPAGGRRHGLHCSSYCGMLRNWYQVLLSS